MDASGKRSVSRETSHAGKGFSESIVRWVLVKASGQRAGWLSFDANCDRLHCYRTKSAARGNMRPNEALVAVRLVRVVRRGKR